LLFSIYFRQRSPTVGNKSILEHISKEFIFPNNFKELIYISQLLQTLSIKYACEWWRTLKVCDGILYWQLNDIWPGFSWSSIEYNGNWKILQHYSKKFFSPILIACFENEIDENLEIYLMNDFLYNVEGQLDIKLININNINDYISIYNDKYEINKQEKKVIIKKSFKNYNKNEYFLYLKYDNLINKDDNEKLINIQQFIDNYYFFNKLKKIKFSKSKIELKVKNINKENNIIELNIKSNVITFFVYLTSKINGKFSDNGFHLIDNDFEKKIYFYYYLDDNEIIEENNILKNFEYFSLN
jgi:beta-mannosidase